MKRGHSWTIKPVRGGGSVFKCPCGASTDTILHESVRYAMSPIFDVHPFLFGSNYDTHEERIPIREPKKEKTT